MKILSEYMNDPFGVELNEPFETQISVERPKEGEDYFEPVVSVNFFELIDGTRPEHPQENRLFYLPNIEGLPDNEIIYKLGILVPKLKK